MRVDITSLGMPLHHLASCGVYFSACLDSPFIYVTKEVCSNTYPYRCLFHDGVSKYVQEWTQKGLAKEVGCLLDYYCIDFGSLNFYNGIFAAGNHSKFDFLEEANFKRNVRIAAKWQKKSALMRKLRPLDDLLR